MTTGEIVNLVIIFFCTTFLTVAFTKMNGDNYWEKKIIEHRYGLYCPKDGDFAFNGECNDK